MSAIFSRLEPKEKQVYRYIRDYGPVSKQDILNAGKDFSSSTLSRLLNEFVKLRLIEEIGYGKSTGGRKPILYKINAESGYLFGLDITRIATRLALFDAEMNMLGVRRWRMSGHTTPAYLLDEIGASVRSLLAERGIAREQVWGMGIGAVGPIDRGSGIIVNPSHFLSEGWEQVRICEAIRERCQIPAILDNGANTSLVGEARHIPNSDQLQLIYIHLGVGWRSSVMARGNLVYGAIDTEGAIGQMIIRYDGAPPRIKGQNFGSVESYVSVAAMEDSTRSQLKMGWNSSLRTMVEDVGQVSFEDMLKALSDGDEQTRTIFRQTGVYLGIGLSNVINILHPDVVILGGPLISTNDILFAEAKRVAMEKICYSSLYKPQFMKSRLGDDAGMTGAACLFASTLLNEHRTGERQ